MDTITDIILFSATATVDFLDSIADLLPQAALTIIPASFAIACGMAWLI